MNYVDFEAGNKAYKLRLNIRNIVALEKAIGCNPLGIFGDGDTIPTITTMVNVLFASLQQYHHGITLNDAYDIFEAWLEEGNAPVNFLMVILDVYRASGLIPKEATEKN